MLKAILLTPIRDDLWIVSLVLTEKFEGEIRDACRFLPLALDLGRVMYSFSLLVSLAALAILDARKVFGVPAMPSTFFSIFSILSGASLGWWLDPDFGARSLFGLAIGVLVGGLAQWLVQAPALVRSDYRFGLDFQWRDAGVRRVLQLMVPAAPIRFRYSSRLLCRPAPVSQPLPDTGAVRPEVERGKTRPCLRRRNGYSKTSISHR